MFFVLFKIFIEMNSECFMNKAHCVLKGLEYI